MKYISTIIILFTILNGCISEKLSEQKLKALSTHIEDIITK